uniref:DUF5745 domain-containing protein n=1 Tax=Gadus morhua TaxID=8049 RepID=A0A8C5CCV5_GADMO
MGTQEGEEDWVDVANDLLRKCGVNFRLTKLADCVGNVFLAFYENILGVKVPGVIADPKTPEDDIHNVQSVIDSLALDYLQISLSHITGENLVRGDKESIKNLLEIFDGLLEYLNEEISEELHNGGLNEGLTEVFLPAVGRDGLRSTEQVVADMLERTSLSSSEWWRRPSADGTSWWRSSAKRESTTRDCGTSRRGSSSRRPPRTGSGSRGSRWPAPGITTAASTCSSAHI